MKKRKTINQNWPRNDINHRISSQGIKIIIITVDYMLKKLEEKLKILSRHE